MFVNKTVNNIGEMCRSEIKQFTMHCRAFLFVLAIYLHVTAITCYFNPFMDSEYFSIDWSGHESSKPDDVRMNTNGREIFNVTSKCDVHPPAVEIQIMDPFTETSAWSLGCPPLSQIS